MAESGLSIGFTELIGETGKFLGYGYKAYASYSAAKQVELSGIVQSGVRRVYYPPAINKDTLGYEWSWLRPTTTLSIESGTADYDLPDDFGRLVGAFHYPEDKYLDSIAEVSVGKLLSMRSYASNTGSPKYVAVRFKTEDRTTGSRQEALFYPESDDDWTLLYEYEAYSGALSTSYPYPLGGMKFAELYIESCLAVAESRINDEIGNHAQQFQTLLIDAIARDRKHGAQFYGQMGHKESNAVEFRRGWTGSTYPITYNGIEI